MGCPSTTCSHTVKLPPTPWTSALSIGSSSLSSGLSAAGRGLTLHVCLSGPAETVKVVRIQDRALGIVALVLQLATVIFIVFNLILGQEKGYLKYEPVTGTVGGQLIGTVQGLNTSSLSYCQDGSVCRFLDMFSIVAADPEPSSIFISTYMREHRQKRVCDVDADVCDRHSPFETVATREYFVAGVEEYNVLVSHDAQATQMFLETRDERYRGDQSTMSGTLQKYMDDGTGRVRLMVTRTFEEGKPILLSVGELLASAGLSFDSVLPGYFAPIRKSGVHINCYITYSNTWNWLSPAPSIQYSLEVFPGVQVGPVHGQTKLKHPPPPACPAHHAVCGAARCCYAKNCLASCGTAPCIFAPFP